ncbi:MAG: phospho-N-acetylmuramoyl-pentapeptide-transferase [Candidatus Woykebacteria bacterium RBG_13_40_15]|uniref:Phospho-N-acetylmuramoyl-pentapeptide-transferase n=1 Tax=Candidatus Woykebacteria bacterium RBG_13_40_15 TaxID=1802593 RepID=A0A1G1WAE8_9BACT|nr:MAG: phospho-N-acetylmuramoyl-pentapeptide-transferase [Candidatus Woykebacteria bacterium RBG_13_40_15]
MVKLLGILLFSFAATFAAAVPFINLLYKLKFQRQREAQKDIFGHFTSIVNRLHGWKVGTPNAGGILIILVTIFFSALFYKLTKYHLNWTAYILYITLTGFGILGLYDDIRKFYGFKIAGVWGLRIRYKFLLQLLLSLLIGYLLFSKMGLSSIHVPIANSNIELGPFYIIWAALIVFATTNAVNITDGLDGLATGSVIISLVAFWYLASLTNFGDIDLFIAVTIGSLLAFLYFNIYPARVWLGDTGALPLGAMLAVVALILNASLVLPFIGLIFVVEAASSLAQMLSKGLFHQRVFIAAPLHHHFEAKGWDETKVTMRFWLGSVAAAFIGVFIALL